MAAKVLLGSKDEDVGKHDTHWGTSKVGGQMDWYAKPEDKLTRCQLCGGILSSIMQVYCPLAGSMFHRTLYLLACSQKVCWNKPESWRVIRQQSLDTSADKSQESNIIGNSNDWGVDSADWGDVADGGSSDTDSWGVEAGDWGADSDFSNKNQDITNNGHEEDSACDVEQTDLGVIQDLQQMELEDSTAAVPSCVSEDVPSYPQSEILQSLLKDKGDVSCNTPQTEVPVFDSFFVSVIEEPPGDNYSHLKHERHLLKEYSTREGVDLDTLRDISSTGKGAGATAEKYERQQARHGDRTFQKFMKRVKRFPDQILRYSWNGAVLPLRNISNQPVIPACEACGGRRVFELQVMPVLVPLLKCNGSSSCLEFGTVPVYTCESSCWQQDASHRTEFIQIQMDPDEEFFRR